MSLKQNPSEKLNLRLRLMVYGKSGAGKTFLGLHFPDVLVLDTQRGTDAYHDMFDFESIQIRSVQSLVEQVEMLESEKHNFKTVLIDSLTDITDFQRDDAANYLSGEEIGQTEIGTSLYKFNIADYRIVNSDYRAILRRIVMLGMNVICTCQEKDEYKDHSMMVPTGNKTMDAGKNTEQWFDTVIRLFSRDGIHYLYCTKDRTRRIPMFNEREISYDDFAQMIGEQVITQSPTITDKCTREQRNQIEAIRKLLNVSASTLRKALSEYEAERLTELTREQADALIARMENYKKEKQNAAS